MPLAGGDVDEGTAGRHVNRRSLGTGIIVKVFDEVSSQAHHRLGGGPVPMDGQYRSRLDGVEHPLGLVGRAVPEVQVHRRRSDALA